jgi:hypothetical protein
MDQKIVIAVEDTETDYRAFTVEKIDNWFKLAVPVPTDKNRAVQLGCHLEEVAEMAESLAMPKLEAILSDYANHYKSKSIGLDVDFMGLDRVELLDSLCDQIVTAIGVAHMFKMNIFGALAEVNESNYSKFVDGLPVFNEHGKIVKGPNYRKAQLSNFAEIHE